MRLSPLLDARGICKNFGGVQALDHVDLAVHRDEVVGLIGPNGAGKTTMSNVICGIAPTKGLPVPSMFFFGITSLVVALLIPEGPMKSPWVRRLPVLRTLASS